VGDRRACSGSNVPCARSSPSTKIGTEQHDAMLLIGSSNTYTQLAHRMNKEAIERSLLEVDIASAKPTVLILRHSMFLHSLDPEQT
jgi:hypothetical protein